MFGVFWEGLLGLILIFSWGGLLALAAWLTPRFVDYVEPGAAPTRFGPEERNIPAAGLSPPLEARPAPPPPRAAIRLEEPADPLAAAAIALALNLHLGAAARPSPPPSRVSPGNPWPLAGRWQAMQTRLQMHKR
jgi:hypothetical protein